MKMFSIIIPLYNKSAYIKNCLQSILNQTFQEFEVIVINDGSSDDGPEKVRKLMAQGEGRRAQSSGRRAQGNIVLIDQPNAGVSVARNNGVKNAKYDYIAFLDADDWWDPHFLEEMKGLIEKCPEAGLFGCNYYYVKNGMNRLEEKGLKRDFRSGYIDYIRIYASTFCAPINCSFVVVPRKFFEEVSGFNPALKFGEDFDLWIRIALTHKVAYLNKPLAYSNQDVPVTQRALGNPKLYDPASHFIFNLDYIDTNEQTNPELKHLLDGLRVRTLLQYHLTNDYRTEVRHILEKVDFSGQTLYYRAIYKLPKVLMKLFLSARKIGSFFKQKLLYKPKIDYRSR